MLLPCWNYIIEANWRYTLYPEMMHTNIFCYGKPHSGKAEKIAIPVAETTIRENRTCIIYAKNVQERYKIIKQLALQKEYHIYELEVKDLTQGASIRKAKEVIETIRKQATLVMISNSDFETPNQHTIVDELLERLYEDNQCESAEIMHKPENKTLILLDDLCGNMLLQSRLMKLQALQFCIIMDSKIAYIPWLKNLIEKFLQDDTLPVTLLKEYVDTHWPEIVQKFFSNIETVICTGVNGVKPEMHRQFVGQAIFDIPSVRIGGRFAIMENPPAGSTQKAKGLIKPASLTTVITAETIENTLYNDIAKVCIRANRWLLEQDGKLKLYFDGATYRPIMFYSQEEAQKWIKKFAICENVEILKTEKDKNMIQYEGIQNGKNTELYLNYIGASDVEYFRVTYLLQVLEIAERDEIMKWLQTDEAIKKGFDPQDSLEKNISKYYEMLDTPTAEEAAEENDAEEQSQHPLPYYPIEPYWAKFQSNEDPSLQANLITEEPIVLPETEVLFLGGHWNMVKKIQQRHPGWLFITDDQVPSAPVINVRYVFYWTAHSSHKMMENIFKKLTPEAETIYVTATNMERLENEMLLKFIQNKNRKRRGETTGKEQPGLANMH